MAISPLALGIGLQGKYDYKRQMALDLARERGRAKAEAAEEAGKEKKRAEIRKMIVNIKPQGLLPFQQKITDDNVADLLNYASENQDDLAGVTQRVFQLESKTKAYRDQAEGYKRLSLQQGGMPADAQVLKAVGTLSDPREIQEYISKYGDTTSIALTGDQLTLDNPKYEGLSTSFKKFITPTMFDPKQGVKEIMIGDRKYGDAEINTEVPKIMTATIMNTDNLKRSALNDYLGYAIDKKIPYDFSTPQGREEFKNNTANWVNENAKAYVASLSKQYGGSKTQFTTNINNAPALTPGEIGAPAEVGVRVVYSGGQRSDVDFSSTSLGFLPRLDDFTITLPTSVGTFNAETGDQVKDSGSIKAIYNGADAHYVASKDAKIPSHWQGFPNGGGAKFIPEKNIKKGQLVDDSEVETLKKQKALDVKFVVFGLTDDGFSIYRTYDEAGIVPILQRSTADKKLVNEAIKNANAKYRDAKAKLYGTSNPAPSGNTSNTSSSGNTGGSPAQAPTGNTKPKPPTPAPKSGEKPKKQPPKGTEDIFGELEKAAKSKNK
jgi:hypothetical protein